MLQLYKTIIKSGQLLAEKKKSKEVLVYEWHDKEYLGAAHGYVGILCTLMQVCV